jgi:hypothetical protein
MLEKTTPKEKFDLISEIIKLLAKYSPVKMSVYEGGRVVAQRRKTTTACRLYSRATWSGVIPIFHGRQSAGPSQVAERVWADNLGVISRQSVQVKILEQQATAQVEGRWSVQCL